MFSIDFFGHVNETEKLTGNLTQQIVIWYSAIRNLAVAITLLILVYVGIRMATSTLADDKARYKTMLIAWVKGFCMMFVLLYLVLIAIALSNGIIDLIPESSENVEKSLMYGNGTIEGCSSNAQISDAQTAGDKKAITIAGFIGTTWLNPGTVTIKGCYAAGTVTSKLEQSTNGGFIGNCTTKADGGTGQQIITNCFTSVNLTEASSKFNGSAFIKNINNVIATECYYVNGTQTIPTGKEENLSIVQKSAADLKGMASSFNSTLNWTDYQFVAGTDTEPLIITRK